MENRIKLFIIDGNISNINQLEDVFIRKQALGIDVIGKAITKNEFFYNKEKLIKTDIFLISSSLPDGDGLKLVEYIKNSESLKQKPVIVTVDKQTLKDVEDAQEYGVEQVFQKPISLKELIKSIKEHGTKSKTFSEEPEEENYLLEAQPNKRKKQLGSFERSIFDEIDTTTLLNNEKNNTTLDLNSKQNLKKGIYTFLSPGSNGVSSIVVNVAYALRTLPETKPTVCIVDLNLLYPSIRQLFNQDELRIPKRDIYDISADLAYMNEELIAEALIKHGPTDLYILNTPADDESLHKIPTIKGNQIERILLQLRDMFDIVLVDAGQDITSPTALVPIENSKEIFTVLEPNYLNIVRSKKIFYAIKMLENTTKEKILNRTHLILNRESNYKNLDDETVKAFLENKTFKFRIVEDPKYLTYINKGQFLIDTNSTVARTIKDIANYLHPIDESTEKNKKSIKLPLFTKKK